MDRIRKVEIRMYNTAKKKKREGRSEKGTKQGKQKTAKPLLTILRLTKYIRRYLLRFLAVFILIMLSAGLGLAPPWIMRYAVDSLIIGGRSELLWIAGIGMLGLSLLEGILGFVSRYAMEYMGQRIV